mmetsp:Transcript_23198/g.65702  ORF Transcript_23198/g.65702 Transcript_23198/m.65702 type:complete len:381 (-) Transcript_23198:73-1215(-)
MQQGIVLARAQLEFQAVGSLVLFDETIQSREGCGVSLVGKSVRQLGEAREGALLDDLRAGMSLDDRLHDIDDGRRIHLHERNRRSVAILASWCWSMRVLLQKHVAEFADAPNADCQQTALTTVVIPNGLQQLVRRVGMNIRRGSRNVHDGGRLHIPRRLATSDSHHRDELVDSPSVVGAEAIHDAQDAGADVTSVLPWAKHQVVQQFRRQRANVLVVDQVVDEFQCPLSNRHIRVLQTVHHGVAVLLQCRKCAVGRGVCRDGGRAFALLGELLLFHDASGKRVERDVSDVVVAIEQEASKNVDGEDSQTVFGFDSHDGLHALVQDGISGVLRRVRVGGNLRQDVVHFFGGLLVLGTQQSEQREQLDLQERVGDSGDVVLR